MHGEPLKNISSFKEVPRLFLALFL